ncbi:MAG: G/U mismatch-specific DNA glycosylase [Heliobacteriaceae bacterium]|nr:G/U mismatch-specific DNA glycosylase [Heliobacteriaceae bacterium]MDD4588496.1 G/U mismatch-specific DNA glycosylase [Heliobacteriaceae bacterium]
MDRPVPDHLAEGLQIVFVGFNPSRRSAETGHHFANPNNRFWPVLHLAGLTPRQYRPEEDGALLALGYGITNIVARPTRAAAEITREEYRQGRTLLAGKIARFRPRVVCFVGKGVYLAFSGHHQAAWGQQPVPVVPGTIDFVAPSTSGLVRLKLGEMVAIYKRLKELM